MQIRQIIFCWLFKLDMERLGIAAKRKPAKVIDFAQYIENNRGTND